MTVDAEKVRRESIRWHILLTLNNASPIGAWEEVILSVTQALYPDETALDLRRNLDYLAERGLVKLVKHPGGRWFADLTRHGVDIAEYTVDCEPGIGRPARYW